MLHWGAARRKRMFESVRGWKLAEKGSYHCPGGIKWSLFLIGRIWLLNSHQTPAHLHHGDTRRDAATLPFYEARTVINTQLMLFFLVFIQDRTVETWLWPWWGRTWASVTWLHQPINTFCVPAVGNMRVLYNFKDCAKIHLRGILM